MGAMSTSGRHHSTVPDPRTFCRITLDLGDMLLHPWGAPRGLAFSTPAPTKAVLEDLACREAQQWWCARRVG
jgi:hypothetical protein